MSKIAYIFPGQGSQYKSMGKDFHDAYRVSADVFYEADKILRQDISKIIFEGPEDLLNMTVITQPALLVTSYAIYKAMMEEGFPEPDYTAGHSLGEYTALLVAGSLTFEEALRLTKLRGEYMQEAVPEGRGSMCAVIKVSSEVVEEVCKNIKSGVVEPANYNSPIQTVISGEKEAVEEASEILKEKGARVIPLKVSVPSHCSLMKQAADMFRIKLAQTPIKNANIPVVQNVTAREHTMAPEIRENLYKQIYSSVRWFQSVEYMVSKGVDTFVEIGPKNVLTKLIQQTVKDVRTFNIEKVEDIEKVKKEL